MRPAARDRLVVAAVALVSRLAVVGWGASRFPPAADGTYYHRIAVRISEGAGYTWVWPDGAVTFAAHYPIGYPAILGLFYRFFGAAPLVAMLVNAAFGVACAVAAYELVSASAWGRGASVVAGVSIAIHPALVPYTLAIMTEGVTAALLVIAAALAARLRQRQRSGRVVLLGVALGVATLVRPQSILLAPIFGWLGSRGPLLRRARVAATTMIVAVACCLPWTARNCVRMHRCRLVSVNAGWNLLIGEASTSGAWQPIEVPDACKTVWDEAEKDACFETAARRKISQNPLDFVSRIPEKLAVTFDYFGGAPWYLHESNPAAFSVGAKEGLGIAETVFSRLALAGALAAFAWLAKKSSRLSSILALAGLPFAFLHHAYVGTLALAIAILASRYARRNVALSSAAWTLLATALTHAVFFGAGRYGLVSSPFVVIVCASAGVRMLRGKEMPSLCTASFKNSFSKS